ncbi:MAG: type II toxin-antitoxin system MqsA family antitoxin [Planctomycetes bacterium]|nr:type II toxin-antitoxin system MqsA family antitoxin [Planctomycetota bacterium]
MKCIHCQAIMKQGVAPVHIDRQGCHVTFDNVPAWVCQQCGEAYFEEQEVNTIQDLIQTVEQKANRLTSSA